jgi:methionine-S-sulfoxide reductase
MTAQQGRELATLGGGRFWCLEAVFKDLKGVESVVSGYAGGHVDHPSYEQVCGGRTGHAEVVQISFDPAVVSYRDLLDVFFTIHDSDHQGPAGRRRRPAVPLDYPLPQPRAEDRRRAGDRQP